MMRRRFWKKEEAPDYIEGKSYTPHQLELMANAILKEDSKRELCRQCGEVGVKTGAVESKAQVQLDEDGEVIGPMTDKKGNQLVIDFNELRCENGHTWFEGEGKAKGFKGENQVLMEEHLIQRKRREIFCAAGTPDPEIVSGMYWRVHEGGRRVNSEEARTAHGASFYS